MSEAKTTTDHDTTRKCRSAHRPPRAGRGDRRQPQGAGILRIDFDEPEERLEQISWERFFEIFDGNDLAFLYQDKTEHGGSSRFKKLVDRKDTA